MSQSKILGFFVFSNALLILLVILAWPHRQLLMLRVLTLLEEPPTLSEPGLESESVAWFDDYFTLEFLDSETIAIGEPRYWQANYSYLIRGEDRAILFDSGSGVRDIKPVVDSLTTLPVTVVSSHLHYDHVGNHAEFDRIALVDLPHFRERTQSGVFRPSTEEHLGFTEGIELPEFRISEWWAPDSQIDLGGRALTVILAPGHTPNSIMLLDRGHGMLFTGDYIYDGPLYAFVPGSDLGDYLRTAVHLLEVVPATTRLLTAHRENPPGAPVLEIADLVDLRDALEGIRAGELRGEGFYIKSYPINERLSLVAEMQAGVD